VERKKGEKVKKMRIERGGRRNGKDEMCEYYLKA
jgi:hypothetical protein